MLQQQVRDLTGRLVGYARLVEDMIERSTAALESRDPTALDEVIGPLEDRANAFEVDLEAAAVALIAQFQPEARDLRAVLMVLGIANDLERLGDHAVNIAPAGRQLLAGSAVRDVGSVPRMARAAVRMIDDAIAAFIAGDAALARRVCESDQAVDDMADGILRETVAVMAADPARIEAGLAVLRVAGNLERVADLATNLGEDVIYLIEGRVIKHRREG